MSMIRALSGLCLSVSLLLPTLALAAPATIDTIAREAVLVDSETGTVLLDKNGSEQMPPSSMSKLMTAYVTFSALKDGTLKLTDTFPVSERAWRMQGSKMFVELGGQIPVQDLLQGVIVQSGNDACVVLAEGIAGSEDAFADRLNAKAKELGLTGSHFVNATGWPDDGHLMTAKDLAILAERLINDFPEYYHYFSEKEFTWHGITQGNRNPLLYRNIGVDGLKTGHTEIAGYGLTASAERGGRRLILVVNGLPDMQARADETARLLDWGFHTFDTYTLFKAGQELDKAKVYLGTSDTVPLLLTKDVRMTLNRMTRKDVTAQVVLSEPLPAPVQRGGQIGTLKVTIPDTQQTVEFPLIAGADVDRLGFFARVMHRLHGLIGGA
jgi:serine-type D-Ala-D-Ala carboxypeptidase (penicillin-binding protein 5/6)